MGTLFVDNIKQQSSQGSGTITIGASGETVALASGVKQSNLLGPSFMAHSNSSSTQTVSNGVWTEVTINDQEEFDTDNFFNTSTGRFSPTVAGKYFFTAQIFAANGIGTGLSSILITKNGSVTLDSKDELGYLERIAIGDNRLQVNGMLSLNGTSDYVSVFMFSNAGNIGIGGGSAKSTGLFGGYRIGT